MLGQVYAFETSPDSEFAAPTTGRYAAFKIIGSGDDRLAIAILDGVWNHMPTLGEVIRAAVLREHRFAHAGRLATFGVQAAWWRPADLLHITLLGEAPLSPEERRSGAEIAAFADGTSHTTLRVASRSAEAEWRWNHDREALVAENEKKQAKAAAARAAQEERYRLRLKGLTWDQLLTETPFERWVTSPPYPPAEFTTAARKTIHDACRDLSKLGSKPKRAQVRAILKTCVEWFNKADAEAGGVIETEEREDIWSVLEEMAFVARQKGLVDEIDEWREW